MLIEDKLVDDTLVVKVCETRVDAHNAGEFKGAMAQFVEDGNQRIALDLSEVEFIDSSGLGAIVACLKSVGRDGKFTMFGLRNTTLSMFRLTRMDRVFDIYESEQDAIAA
ncbi:MAG: STAS domain-containing protein [Pseudomonadota bacterium]